MGEVVDLGVMTTLPIPPDKILESAMGELEYVLVIGYTPEGELWISSSTSNLKDALWAAHEAQNRITDGEL